MNTDSRAISRTDTTQYLGRVFGLLGSIMSFAMPLGLVVSGAFADQIRGKPLVFVLRYGYSASRYNNMSLT